MKFSKLLSAFAIAAALYFAPSVSQAQMKTDLRAGAFGKQSSIFIGGGLRMGIGNSLYLNPMINYAFTNPGTIFFDLDGHFDFPVSAVHLYAGPGLGVYVYDGGTTAQLNLLVGVGFDVSGYELYIQPKFAVAGGSRFLQVGLGARF
ncbi:MAG: hypothetical protein V4642_07710 [Bacteroidota bacterium]